MIVCYAVCRLSLEEQELKEPWGTSGLLTLTANSGHNLKQMERRLLHEKCTLEQ